MLMPGFGPSTSVSTNRHSNHMTNMLQWQSDGTEEFATTGSVDGCSVLQETQFVGTHLRVDTTRVYMWGLLYPYASCRREAGDLH